jgi:hypothetical protein
MNRIQTLLLHLKELGLQDYYYTRIYGDVPGEFEVHSTLSDRLKDLEEDWQPQDLATLHQIDTELIKPLLNEWCKDLGINNDNLRKATLRLRVVKGRVKLDLKVHDIF